MTSEKRQWFWIGLEEILTWLIENFNMQWIFPFLRQCYKTLSKKKWRSWKLIPGENCILSENNELWDYLKPSDEAMLQYVMTKEFVVNRKRKKYDTKNEWKIKRNWKGKSQHGKFPNSIVKAVDAISWLWSSSG